MVVIVAFLAFIALFILMGYATHRDIVSRWRKMYSDISKHNEELKRQQVAELSLLTIIANKSPDVTHRLLKNHVVELTKKFK